MAEKKEKKATGEQFLMMCDGSGNPLKNQPKPIHISARHLGRHNSGEPAGYSPMAITHSIERSAARFDLGISAGMEAGILLKQGISPEEIPDIIKKKYGEQIPKIGEIIAEKIEEMRTDPENFGTISSVDRAIIDNIRKGVEENS